MLFELVLRVGSALCDPTRLDVLMVARENADITVGEIAEVLGYNVSTISRHLDVLQRGGLIERRRSGRRTLVRARADRFARITDAALACAPTRTATPAITAVLLRG
jgi:DNA-binding transcriptional ArsR family regulator